MESVHENVHILLCDEVFPFLVGHLLDEASLAEVFLLQASEIPLKMKVEYEMTDVQSFFNENGSVQDVKLVSKCNKTKAKIKTLATEYHV